MNALNVLSGLKVRAVKLKFADKQWSAIRISKTKKGQPSKLELSRFSGVVGDITYETTEIGVDEDVALVKTDKAAVGKGTAL